MAEIPVYPTAKALIFDIDGTLIDTMPVHYKACQLICNAHGFDFPLDFFNKHAGIPTEETFELLMKELKLGHDGRALGRMKDLKYIDLMNEVKPLKEVYDIVLKYRGKLPMALGTGATKPVAFKTLEAAGLKGMFDIIITPEDVAKPKPAPDTFLLCAERMGIEPQFCQVFEDGDPGIKAARDGGMMVVDIRKYIIA
jgi:beta-phosphoglucomutase-like phosphatase (HAD superfamily)